MQKKLIAALAVAGLVAAPAFAATSNVDVYGQLTLAVDHINRDSAAIDDSNALASYASRIGFKGSEDLGAGMKAIWQIENQFNLDGAHNNLPSSVTGTGDSSFTAGLRNTFVGLSGGFGTVLGGRHDTPYKLATGKLDPFADTAGDYNVIVGAVQGSNNFDLRASNALAYISPTFSGFHGAIAYVFGSETGPLNQDLSAWSLMGMYDNGPVFASLAYEKHNISDLAVDDRDAWKVGLGYNFGNATVGLIYEKAGTVIAGSEEDRSAWYLPFTYTMGNVVLKAAYGSAGDTVNNDGAKYYTIGGDYNLSKRTKLFATYAKTNNDNGGSYNAAVAGDDSYNTAAGEDPSVLQIGVRHSF